MLKRMTAGVDGPDIYLGNWETQKEDRDLWISTA
jgi:hypothetical protein